jgi:hypothetical protein
LGEAEKFGGNKFEEVLERLFTIKTKYLVLVNLFSDGIDYNLLLKRIAQTGEIIKLGYVIRENGENSLGMTIKKTTK